MKKRLWYGSAIVLLAISVGLVVWQGSFNMGQYGPADPSQTLVFWASSSLIFVLMVTLGFILFRTGVKLYIERQRNREGTRIRTRLVVGALTLSFLPVFFLVLFSYNVLHRNMLAWFNRPANAERLEFLQMAELLKREARESAAAKAQLLVARPEIRRTLAGAASPGFLESFGQAQRLQFAAILRAGEDAPLDRWGPFTERAPDERTVVVTEPVREGGRTIGYVVLGSRLPLDIAAQQEAIAQYNHEWNLINQNRKNVRIYYIQLMALITLFVLFVATWIALFLAKQISVPISALLDAAGEVRRGNLKHRVEVRAIDELASLVRGFNEMTRELEANSRELDARRRFTEAILESIPTGVISIGADGSIRRVNRALRKMFPAAHAERASRLEDLFPREDTAEIKYLMKRARRTGAASRQIELRTDTQKLHLSVTVAALEEKLTSGFVVVLEDTSELLRAQKAAAWQEVARRVAHEIKNPLTPIALSAERMARQVNRIGLPRDTERIVSECAETISRSVESVKTLVDAFSQLARFPAAHPSTCDLNEVVDEALAVFSGRLEGIRLRTNLAPGLAPVNVDREQFKRVIVNLVDNAAEAMQDSLVKELHITTQAGAAETVELVIADSGRGVTAEEKERLFLPYFSTKGRGTGLGLAIVSHILADHNALIRVEDNQPVGARFTVEIPAIVESEAAAAVV
jgi:PAS domain S-box-containing protein